MTFSPMTSFIPPSFSRFGPVISEIICPIPPDSSLLLKASFVRPGLKTAYQLPRIVVVRQITTAYGSEITLSMEYSLTIEGACHSIWILEPDMWVNS